MPFPYPTIINNRGHGNAVSLPIAGLTVGKRHCRVLISGNINSDASGFDIITIAVAKTPSSLHLFGAVDESPTFPQPPEINS